MTPEQFSELGRVLPEPCLFLWQSGEILATNRPAASLFGLRSKELKGKPLFNFLTDSQETITKYLQACSRSRKMVLGSLTIHLPGGETVLCRSEGAVVQPASFESPAQILLRLEKREQVNNNFIVLNQKIEELQIEIRSRRKAEAKLKQTLKELQRTQIQLIHKEKLSGLGRMAAGIAHEINNPVSFIHGNLIPAQEYAEDLLELIQLYQHYYPDPVPEIQHLIEDIELEFIMEDLKKLLQSMSVGTQRIREIVKSMRTFSRLDEAEIKKIDLHESLDSTLMLLEHRLSPTTGCPKIEVIKNYGQLPKIQCYSGQINQVFMNILDNAIDALQDNIQEQNPEETQDIFLQITIQTETLNHDWVAIKISDNGIGISQQIQSQMFEPFFTTKAVGQGTGLGLSISHEIITEKHGGKLFCHSKLGEGTDFLIQIPTQLKTSQASPLTKSPELVTLEN